MQITDVRTFLVQDRERPERNYAFVKVSTDEGLTGLGEAGVTGKELAPAGLIDTYAPISRGDGPVPHRAHLADAVAEPVLPRRARFPPAYDACLRDPAGAGTGSDTPLLHRGPGPGGEPGPVRPPRPAHLGPIATGEQISSKAFWPVGGTFVVTGGTSAPSLARWRARTVEV